MTALIIFFIIIQFLILVLAVSYVWEMHGLEVAVFILGTASIATLGILSLKFVNT
jgi:hypothetical protein